MSNKKKDGGPAFPIVGTATDEDQMHRCYGMSLRDYFAASVLQGVLGNQERMKMLIEKDGLPADGFEASERLAARCYQMADAMLKTREQ